MTLVLEESYKGKNLHKGCARLRWEGSIRDCLRLRWGRPIRGCARLRWEGPCQKLRGIHFCDFYLYYGQIFDPGHRKPAYLSKCTSLWTICESRFWPYFPAKGSYVRSQKRSLAFHPHSRYALSEASTGKRSEIGLCFLQVQSQMYITQNKIFFIYCFYCTILLQDIDKVRRIRKKHVYLIVSFLCTVTYISQTLPWGMAPAGISKLTPEQQKKKIV